MRKKPKPASRPSRLVALKTEIRPLTWKGRPGFWAGVRHLVWSWWFWALISLAGIYADNSKMVLIGGGLAVFTYLVTPYERSPRYGLDTRFSVESSEFIGSMVGATGRFRDSLRPRCWCLSSPQQLALVFTFSAMTPLPLLKTSREQ